MKDYCVVKSLTFRRRGATDKLLPVCSSHLVNALVMIQNLVQIFFPPLNNKTLKIHVDNVCVIYFENSEIFLLILSVDIPHKFTLLVLYGVQSDIIDLQIPIPYRRTHYIQIQLISFRCLHL